MSTKGTISSHISLLGFDLGQRHIRLILLVFPFLLYANTLTHEYTMDDAIVIHDNMFVEQGLKGIPGLLKKDTFFGFFKVEGKSNLVSGGRYRPLTPIMFAIEWQIFGYNPFAGHLINVLLFCLLCLLLYQTLFKLFEPTYGGQMAMSLSFFAALIFAAHPIHTEAVANVKGRDEIVALLSSLYALLLVLKYIDSKSIKYLIGSVVVFFLGLLSKENTITFLAVIPLALVLFRKETWKKAIGTSLVFLLPILIFIGIRYQVLGYFTGNEPTELMNNPFMKIVGNAYVPFEFGEKMSTIVFTLGKYINLLFFPHPLTHDYYPRHVDMMSWTDPAVILSIIMYIVMIYAAFKYFKKHKVLSFSIFYYLITLSIVSNVVILIGTNMSERFMFMPSVGYATLLASFFLVLKNKKISFALLAILLLAFSAKTITRNMVWKDNFTLFTTDVHTSTKSAKLLNAAGGALSTEGFKEKNEVKRKKMLLQADEYLRKAIEIHPNYKNAYLLLGNTNYFLRNYEPSIQAYQQALKIAPGYEEAIRNYKITLRDAGRYYGEEKKDITSALKYLKQSYQLDNKDSETLRLLGVASGISGDADSAIKYFKEAVALSPDDAQTYVNLGTAFRNKGNVEEAELNFQKALSLDPAALNHLQK